VLASGSRTGKSTSELALFYFYLFHNNFEQTPIYIVNVDDTVVDQPLYDFANLKIKRNIN
jgi:hypothetical protein